MRNVAKDSGQKKTRKQKNRSYVGPWFRVYADDLNNANLQLLPAEIKWTWLGLSCIASKSNGRLPEHNQIAFELRLSPVVVEAHIGTLINAGMIEQKWDAGPAPYLQIVGWEERQFVADRSALRMRKLRQRKRSVTASDGGGDVTCDGKSDDNPVFSSSLPPKEEYRHGSKSSHEGSEEVEVGVYARESR